MAKARVHELAKEFGVTSKEVLAALQDMGEFVKSASSTVEPPVIRRVVPSALLPGFKPTLAAAPLVQVTVMVPMPSRGAVAWCPSRACRCRRRGW